MYQTVLFDLDGTLTDPGVGITNSVAYALEKYGIHNTDRSQLYKFIGPPLRESFGQFYGFSKEQAEEATAYYREYYKDKGIYENRLYQGIPELLQMLADAGAMLLVATSKPEQFACRILDYFSIRKYFTYVAGATMDGSRSKKSEIIEDALRAGNISDLSSAIMVGDREYDIFGARQAGIASIGVLFGYGSKEELVAAGADYLAMQPAEIHTFVTGQKS